MLKSVVSHAPRLKSQDLTKSDSTKSQSKESMMDYLKVPEPRSAVMSVTLTDRRECLRHSLRRQVAKRGLQSAVASLGCLQFLLRFVTQYTVSSENSVKVPTKPEKRRLMRIFYGFKSHSTKNRKKPAIL